MTEQELSTLGERLAFHRKRRGLSQVELGRLVGRSESWVSQVERDARKVDRLSVLAQVAEVLEVPVSELAPETPGEGSATEHAPWADALRLALTGHPTLATLFEEPRAPFTTADPASLVEQAWSLVHASRYSEAAPILADLIHDLETTVRYGADPTAFAPALARTYQAVAALFAKVDDAEAAWLASDRALFAGERAADPEMVAAGQYRLAQVLLSTGRRAQSRHAAAAGVAALRPHIESADPGLISVYGALHLVLAIGAARDGSRQAAWRAIEGAEDAAARLGQDRNDYGTEFGPTNVGLHAVAVAVELSDAGEALERAALVDPSPLSPERRARFLVDVARAHAQRRNRAAAVAALQDAEAIAPEQIHDHGAVRVLIRDLLQDSSRRSDQGLQALAARCGVPV